MGNLARYLAPGPAALLLLVLAATSGSAAVSENLLRNPSFEAGADAYGVPEGWSLYAGGGADQSLSFVSVANAGKQALRLEDGDPTSEIGITQTVDATPGLAYQATAHVRGIEGSLRPVPTRNCASCPPTSTQTALAAPCSKEFTPFP